ncbi:hypothetical protein LTR49_012410 [Elasticomyces elasticus]|nr:hypothetical protein LTR49_012410 [Elasticomyces elasticus]
MAPIMEPSHLVNPLATSSQLETSASQIDELPRDLEYSIRYESSRLNQAAGMLLRLPQEIIAQSIVILQRCWAGEHGISILKQDPKDTAAAALYLTAKPSTHSISPRQLLTVFDFLNNLKGDYTGYAAGDDPKQSTWTLSESEYESRRECLYATEAVLLRTLGFDTHVALPYTLCINYLQTLEAFDGPESPSLARRVFSHLNSALSSPQRLYLTHQPCVLATASIYLAAREIGFSLPDVEWWEVFDVDREELGFLVVALRSLEGFVEEEKATWANTKVPLTVKALRAYIAQLNA